LASTKDITTFGTLHVAFVNPVFAAKQMVTADHIGHGRFGLNVVSGWNPVEFGMMGVELGDHDGRYDYSEEWLTIVKRIWSEDKPFDFDGHHYKLKAVMAKPKPWWGSRPILVSAGNSKTGSDFAARNADCLFTTVPGKHEELQPKLKAFRDAAPAGQLRNIFASCHLMVRRTRKEAEDYHHYIVYEQGDWESAEYALNLRGQRVKSWFTTDDEKKMKARLISGAGFPLVGSYDDAVEMMQRLHGAGLDGLALGMINYVNDFPGIRDELLPRMERAGLREPQRHGASQRQDDLVH
jgi:alkanesulfonate monooxygenase SsuD/methylene tetrahydromethanopterin reductase-like flavin-dependent oxidoreductase (luciferase family)